MTVRVSDHAVVRFLERVQGVDIDNVRARIAAMCKQAAELGANSAVIRGHRYILNNEGMVVTIEPIGRYRRISRTRQMQLGRRES